MFRRFFEAIVERCRAAGLVWGKELYFGATPIPGIGRHVAEALVAEVGTDMARFPSAHHLASWVGMCPGNRESAGKRQGGKTRRGSPWLRALLIQAAHTAARRRSTYLAAQYRRLAARRGRARVASRSAIPS